jgi:hypothetical protein
VMKPREGEVVSAIARVVESDENGDAAADPGATEET